MFGKFTYVTLHVDNLFINHHGIFHRILLSPLKHSNLDSHQACLQLGLPSIRLCDYSTDILVSLCMLLR